MVSRPLPARDVRFGGLPLEELQERARRVRLVLSPRLEKPVGVPQ